VPPGGLAAAAETYTAQTIGGVTVYDLSE